MDGLYSLSHDSLDLVAACALIGYVVAYLTVVAWGAIREAENSTAAPPEVAP